MKKYLFILLMFFSFTIIHPVSAKNEIAYRGTLYFIPRKSTEHFYGSNIFRNFGLSHSPFFSSDHTRKTFLSGEHQRRPVSVRAHLLKSHPKLKKLTVKPQNAVKTSVRPVTLSPQPKIYTVTAKQTAEGKVTIIRGGRD